MIDYHEFRCGEIVTVLFGFVVTGRRVQMYRRFITTKQNFSLCSKKTLRKANIHSAGYGTVRFISINKCIRSYREPYEYFSRRFILIIECHFNIILPSTRTIR